MMEGKHTIILAQPAKNKATRTYMDYETVSAAMDGICGLFERKLKELNPNMKNISYEVSDLYKYIESYPDLCALVLDPQLNAYVPYAKDWIKKRIFTHLKKQAGT